MSLNHFYPLTVDNGTRTPVVAYADLNRRLKWYIIGLGLPMTGAIAAGLR